MQADDEPGCSFLFKDSSDEQTPIAFHYDKNGKLINCNPPSQFLRLLGRATKRRRCCDSRGLRGPCPRPPVKFCNSPTQRLEDDNMDGRSSQMNDGDDEDDDMGGNDERNWEKLQIKVAEVEKTVKRTKKIRQFYLTCKHAQPGTTPVWVPTPSEVADGVDPSRPECMPYSLRARSIKKELRSQNYYLQLLQRRYEPIARNIILKWYKAYLINLRTLGSQGAPLALGPIQHQALRALSGPPDCPPINTENVRKNLPDGFSIEGRYPSEGQIQVAYQRRDIQKTGIVQWLSTLEEYPPPQDDYKTLEDGEPVYRPYATDMEMFEYLGYSDAVLKGQEALSRVVPGGVRFPNVMKGKVEEISFQEEARKCYAICPSTQDIHSSVYCPRSRRKYKHGDCDNMSRGN
ncbi:hypothetical protein KEM54_006067 [Ascosphaera aggregata]|nr:hypothetical protein KEM54_006067 [Ascosphaera aggregata]